LTKPVDNSGSGWQSRRPLRSHHVDWGGYVALAETHPKGHGPPAAATTGRNRRTVAENPKDGLQE